MFLLKIFDLNLIFILCEFGFLLERLIVGLFIFKIWVMDEVKDGKVFLGVWEVIFGEMKLIKGEVFEFCYIFFGVVEIILEGGEFVIYKVGDSFVMKFGFVGVWKMIEIVCKIYVVVN